MIAALIAALMAALGLIPPPTTIIAPATGLEHAVRLSQQPPIVLANGEITDTTGFVVSLLRELYTLAELRAGGEVIIRTADTGIYRAWVLWNGLCVDAPICMEINPTKWPTETVESNRAVIAHEWAHVLTARYQAQMTAGEHRRFDEAFLLVDQECMADSLAATILDRQGFPPSATRYQCSPYWIGKQLEPIEMEQLSLLLAQTVLSWAEKQ